jgi:aminomuconate-semialdehyde/2-hydroxymuconate-6-semialdehyde dehydrogenase
MPASCGTMLFMNSAVFLEDPYDEIFKHVMVSFLIGQGQLVWNSSRLFILEKFERQWEERIKNYLASLRPSEGLEDSSIWTPCLKKDSFYQFAEIRKMASDDQAQLLQASYSLTESQKKNFLPPLFTKDMSRCSTLQQDQIHAPFFILSTVKYPFDVVKFSNVSYYGFAAHIWGDQVKLSKLTDGLDVGMVCYNKSSVEVAGAFSAVKQSGFGLQDFQSFGTFFSNVKKVTE